MTLDRAAARLRCEAATAVHSQILTGEYHGRLAIRLPNSKYRPASNSEVTAVLEAAHSLPLALDALDAADRRAAELEAALREMARGCRACSGTGVVRVPDFANAGMTEFGPLPGGKTVGCSDCRPARDVLGLPSGEKP